MRLDEFSVTNYRSITSANKIKIKDLTVLVGKNNEGKSNLLTALNVAMNAAIYRSDYRYEPNYTRIRYGQSYDWKRDFPLQLQHRKSNFYSFFELTFELDSEEIKELFTLTGIRCSNGRITIKIRIGKDNTPMLSVPKQGTSSYNEKASIITEFISKRINFNYIQAVRTDGMTIGALQNAVDYRLRSLERNEEYKAAMETIDRLRQESLAELNKRLTEPLKVFIPNLKSINISVAPQVLRRNDFDIVVDDGTPTSISNKGDGIKSLITLAVLKERNVTRGASVIAIEEPESHLHPGAIHNLAEVIKNLSEDNQVIISTHNPLFVSLSSIDSNIIVDQGSAKPAKQIDEVRNVLGVLPIDNLRDMRFALVVEGITDQKSLTKILPMYSKTIRDSLNKNELIIYPIHGAGKLSNQLNYLRNSMCKYIVLLDNDKAGRDAVDDAKSKELITDSQVRLTTWLGAGDSEFEDCINPQIYEKALKEKYAVTLDCKAFKGNGKWSLRMQEAFKHCGVPKWNEDLENEIKVMVSEQINTSNEPVENIILEYRSGFLNSLVAMIEQMLQSNVD